MPDTIRLLSSPAPAKGRPLREDEFYRHDASLLDVLKAIGHGHDPYGLWPPADVGPAIGKLEDRGLVEGRLYPALTDAGAEALGLELGW